jgi:hypothetical protein
MIIHLCPSIGSFAFFSDYSQSPFESFSQETVKKYRCFALTHEYYFLSNYAWSFCIINTTLESPI